MIFVSSCFLRKLQHYWYELLMDKEFYTSGYLTQSRDIEIDGFALKHPIEATFTYLYIDSNHFANSSLA